MRFAILLPAALSLGACGVLPRDPDHTLKRIERTHSYRVGVADDPGSAGAALIRRIDGELSAHATIERGALEPLLVRLEAGEIDMVIADFAKPSPWVTRVALAPPLATRTVAGETLLTRAALRNGENRWIMLVERNARAVAPPGLPS